MAPPRRRRTGLIAAVAAGAFVVVALAAGGVGYALAGRTDPTPAAAPAPAVTSDSASPSPSTGDKARRACERLVAASRVEDVYKAADLPGLKEAADAAADAHDNTSVALGGMLLQDVLATSEEEHGNGNDSDWPGRVAKAVQGLRHSCGQYGFPV